MQKAHHTDSTEAKILHRDISFPHCAGYTQYNIILFLTDPKKIFQGLAVNYSTSYTYILNKNKIHKS